MSTRPLSQGWRNFLLLSLILGAILRLIWIGDMEYKYDEQFMFLRTQNFGSEPFPWIGMASGVGTRNPGLSVWIFIFLAKVFGVSEPTDLARAVQILNIIALIALAYFAVRIVDKESERTPWLWTVALACVNPMAVLFQKKIWAQDTVALFAVGFIAAWWRRDRWQGALLWGLLGACLGQIHMAGFFLAGALFVWTLLFGRKLPDPKAVKWKAWFVGSLLGSVGLVPWIYALATIKNERNAFVLRLPEALRSPYWYYWVTDSLGLGTDYSLGDTQFRDFQQYPLVGSGGTPTYWIGACHLIAASVGIYILIRTMAGLWARRERVAEILIGFYSESAFLQNAALIGMGILISLPGFVLFRHYLIITFPLEFLWISRQAVLYTPKPARTLGVLWLAQLFIAMGFAYYIHVNHGATTGDYGLGYQYQ